MSNGLSNKIRSVCWVAFALVVLAGCQTSELTSINPKKQNLNIAPITMGRYIPPKFTSDKKVIEIYSRFLETIKTESTYRSDFEVVQRNEGTLIEGALVLWETKGPQGEFKSYGTFNDPLAKGSIFLNKDRKYLIGDSYINWNKFPKYNEKGKSALEKFFKNLVPLMPKSLLGAQGKTFYPNELYSYSKMMDIDLFEEMEKAIRAAIPNLNVSGVMNLEILNIIKNDVIFHSNKRNCQLVFSKNNHTSTFDCEVTLIIDRDTGLTKDYKMNSFGKMVLKNKKEYNHKQSEHQKFYYK